MTNLPMSTTDRRLAEVAMDARWSSLDELEQRQSGRQSLVEFRRLGFPLD